ncbi:hypothetical protein CAEBREN_04540 [Caenorhabditis brenneri]|uniref:Uncharacterized protein n=1 Tax=Caenorhabditis brenneri TaxID=135651 RepID=G0M8P8_CAEBE|nr:hypothetical protein CAEBREN_04540 [Caenorhabditis brenneri]
MFAKRCNSDAEFRLIQCCSSCNIDGIGMAYDLIARSLVSEHCFDRYGPKFCDRYVNKTDVFEPHNTWSCDGENPQIAFRTCRKSCGYCNFSVVQYTLDNALQCFRSIHPVQTTESTCRSAHSESKSEMRSVTGPPFVVPGIISSFKTATVCWAHTVKTVSGIGGSNEEAGNCL